jgi:hypothetical protein
LLVLHISSPFSLSLRILSDVSPLVSVALTSRRPSSVTRRGLLLSHSPLYLHCLATPLVIIISPSKVSVPALAAAHVLPAVEPVLIASSNEDPPAIL